MAAVFWILLGIIIGILLPLFYFSGRHRRETEQLEQDWAQRLRDAEHKTAKEIGAHNQTRAELTAANSKCSACEKELQQLRNAPPSAEASGESRAQELAAAEARIQELENELAAARRATKPTVTTTGPDGRDKLTLIKGIGPVLEKKLHDLGITTFAQIAAFSEDDIARVNEVLNFPGRIERENWIGQAAEFASE